MTLLLEFPMTFEPASIETTLLVAVSLDDDDELELDDEVAEFELLFCMRFDAAAATAAAAAIAALTADDEFEFMTCKLVPPPDDELDDEELAEELPELPMT